MPVSRDKQDLAKSTVAIFTYTIDNMGENQENHLKRISEFESLVLASVKNSNSLVKIEEVISMYFTSPSVFDGFFYIKDIVKYTVQ